ncbi:MAG: hypothetical protein ABIS67_13915, partial [Candidatus Eisenbacteria bacterium]
SRTPPRGGSTGAASATRTGSAAAPVTPSAPASPPAVEPPRESNPPVIAGNTATMGTLEVDLKPEVPVYVNDDRVSITGYKRLSLPRGTYTVRAVYRDFEFRREVQVEPGRTVQVAYDLLLASTGRLRLTLESEEGWGTVILDGIRRREQAPGVLEGLSPGPHTISVEGPQYQLDGPPIRVEVVAGKTVDVPIRLKLKGAVRK